MHSVLKLLPPEMAHKIGLWAMRHLIDASGKILQPVDFCGYKINNRLGLAAGFDKNGVLVDRFEHYGFGFLEVGSVTWFGGKGNPKPRLFRLPNGDLLNRMGLNGDSAHTIR